MSVFVHVVVECPQRKRSIGLGFCGKKIFFHSLRFHLTRENGSKRCCQNSKTKKCLERPFFSMSKAKFFQVSNFFQEPILSRRPRGLLLTSLGAYLPGTFLIYDFTKPTGSPQDAPRIPFRKFPRNPPRKPGEGLVREKNCLLDKT